MVRPDDLSLMPEASGNGQVVWRRYEGETRLYAVSVDGAQPLRVRTNHEVDLALGTPRLGICANHPLTVFPLRDANTDRRNGWVNPGGTVVKCVLLVQS